MAAILAYLFVERQIEIKRQPKLLRIDNGVFLTSQLKPDDVRYLRQNRIRTVVDMRPDGEAVDQPSSDEMRRATERVGIQFHYIPVPHDNIPDTAVDTLKGVLDEGRGSAVLYCRTGRRAVRLFALANSARQNGPGAEEIIRMVKSAGFTADDLADRITERIARRAK